MASSRIQFCSNDSTKSGESPIGSAWYTPELIVIELPLPWPGDTLTGKNIPAGLNDLVYKRYETHGYGWGLIGCAPDDAYSVPGYFRVMHCTISPNSLGRFDRRSYLVPQAQMTESIEALFAGEILPGIEEIQEDSRDILLCTQGSVDACCAKFGYPLYKLMRQMADNSGSNVRVWRSTHFGGHRFAPTFLEVPSGRYWGRITPQEASSLIHQTREADTFRHLYRGSATMPDPVSQAIEGELLAQTGWSLDDADIDLFDVNEHSEGIWKATGSVTLADRSRIPFEIDCVQTDVVSLKAHCSYDLITDAPQFETNFRLLNTVGQIPS